MKKLLLILPALVLAIACSGTSPETHTGCTAGQPEKDPSEMLATGQKAPNFTAPDQEGNPVTLSDYQGKKNVVLIFYPGDDTPGCTKQLCAARDTWGAYREADAVLFGVNPASAKSHQDFVDKYSFPFPILVDDEEEVVSAYSAKGALWTKRTVYGIDKNGTIVFAERGMPETEEILAAF